MLQKLLILLGMLGLVWCLVDTNLKGHSVYYAKHSSSKNSRDLELVMLVDNLDSIPRSTVEGVRYNFDAVHMIGTDSIFLADDESDDGLKQYLYVDDKRKSYYFDSKFKLIEIIDVKNEMKHIDITTVNENNVKNEIYKNLKPVLQELENDKPLINLQWVFNWVYRDRIN